MTALVVEVSAVFFGDTPNAALPTSPIDRAHREGPLFLGPMHEVQKVWAIKALLFRGRDRLGAAYAQPTSEEEVSKAVVPTAKDINEEAMKARSSALDAIQHAIRCGELLLERKRSMDHGTFMPWIERHCEFAYSTASRYMTAARKHAKGEAIPSLGALFVSGESITHVDTRKPLQISTTRRDLPTLESPHITAASATKPKSGESQTAGGKAESARETSPAPSATPSESPREAPAPQAQKSNQAGVTTESAGESHAASASLGASLGGSPPFYTDGQLVTIAEGFDPDAPERPDDMEDLDRQGAESFDRERQASIDKWLQADDKLCAAQKEIDRQAAEIVALKASCNGQMNKASEAIKLVKQRDRTVAKLEKDLKKANDELDKLRERIAIMEAA